MVTKVQFVKAVFAALLLVAAFGNVKAENLVTNPGFETAETTYGSLPNTYGDWNGDYSGIVETTSGITPVEGSKMLQMLATGSSGAGSANTFEIWQLIDVSNYHSLIASGNARAEAFAYFNRIAGDAQTDTATDLVIMACDGQPNTFSSRWYQSTYGMALALNHVPNFRSDSLPQTWERLDVTLNLPTNTTFLVVNINLSENVYNDSSYPEFGGHFVDNTSLQIVPEPSTMILLGAGIFGLLRRK